MHRSKSVVHNRCQPLHLGLPQLISLCHHSLSVSVLQDIVYQSFKWILQNELITLGDHFGTACVSYFYKGKKPVLSDYHIRLLQVLTFELWLMLALVITVLTPPPHFLFLKTRAPYQVVRVTLHFSFVLQSQCAEEQQSNTYTHLNKVSQ